MVGLSTMGVGDKDKVMDDIDVQCCHCKKKMRNEDDLLKHVAETHEELKELFKCIICAKHFGNQNILQLHLQVHEANKNLSTCENNTTKSSSSSSTNLAAEFCEDNEETERRKQLLFESPPKAKRIGLTKIRLEDCLRCDACSCIYLDDSDYHKHMRNFHREAIKKQRQRRPCRSCCKHCKCDGDHQQRSNFSSPTNHLHFKIKDRWRKIVSARMDCEKIPLVIKTEQEPLIADDTVDYSHLLSQVEVRIKTEPQDDTEHIGPLEV